MKFSLKTLSLIIFSVFMLNISGDKVFAEKASQNAKVEKCKFEDFITVNPLQLVEQPGVYMEKEIKFQAQFHKFSTLGLDYDKAMRDSKDYISVLIKRPDVPEKYVIPLSELKLIIKRDEAEEMLDMESGDKVEITGKVFSSALNDPWVDIYELSSLEPKNKEKEDSLERKAEN